VVPTLLRLMRSSSAVRQLAAAATLVRLCAAQCTVAAVLRAGAPTERSSGETTALRARRGISRTRWGGEGLGATLQPPHPLPLPPLPGGLRRV
jgi:hypothetical protein